MLGNAQSKWPTVKVAEVYARMVTGLKVKAEFFEPNAQRDRYRRTNRSVSAAPMLDKTCDRGPATRALKPDGEFCQSNRVAILKGMYGAFYDGSGTARRMKDTYEAAQDRANASQGPEFQICVYAKTGTPQIPVVKEEPLERVVTTLGGSDVGYFTPRKVQIGGNARIVIDVNVGGSVLRGDDPSFATVDQYRNELMRRLSGDWKVELALTQQKQRLEDLVQKFVDYKYAASQEEAERIVNIRESGTLTGVLLIGGDSPRVVERKSETGKSLAFVVTAHKSGGAASSHEEFCTTKALSKTPVRAYSVAVSVPSILLRRGSERLTHLNLGEKVLDQISKRYLTYEDLRRAASQ